MPAIQVRGGIWDVLDTLNMYIAKWIFHRDKFFKAYFESKIEDEYKKCDGISTLFVKGQKL